MNYDFSRLTEAQQGLIVFEGWTVECKRPQPTKATVKKLIERGLVIEHVRNIGNLSVAEYEVPISVHMAYCQKCSNYKRKEK